MASTPDCSSKPPNCSTISPTPGSQCDTLLNAMYRGEKLTVLTAMDKYGVYALSQRAGELERMGWKVKRGWLELPSGKRIRTYAL